MKLSVVIPVYNEVKYIEKIIDRVKNIDIEKEIILVDDCSTDGTYELIKQFDNVDGIKVFHHAKNQGKGAALRTGFADVKGDIVIIQDADLEYDPNDYYNLIEPIKDGRTQVVYGSRFLKDMHVLTFRKFFYITHYLGNKLLNMITNLLYGSNLTDMETCYKVMTKEVLNRLELSESRFEIEPAITANILRKGYSIVEIPISYNPRDYKDGKKITWLDAVSAIRILVKYRFKKDWKK